MMKTTDIRKYVILVLLIACTKLTSAMQLITDDTIPLRYRNYYYTDWYDECDSYKNNGRVDEAKADEYIYDWYTNQNFAKYEYTSHPMQVKGLVALVRPDFYESYGWPPLSPEHTTEYMYLLRGFTRINTFWDTLNPGCPVPWVVQYIDSVRFDTIEPRVMTLSQGCDSVPPHYCLAYEAYFDKPITVDSVFYITRSYNGSRIFQYINNQPRLNYTPLSLCEILIRRRQDTFNTCSPLVDSAQWCHSKGHGNTMEVLSLHDSISMYIPRDSYIEELRLPPPVLFDRGNYYYPDDPFGWLFPIVENYRLDVYTDSLPMGDVDGSGLYYRPDAVIRAIPHAGYAFRHWNDGNTDNPRTVYLTRDTSYTAYFSSAYYYEIQTSVNNREWGYVEGGGVYAEQTDVELTAVPYDYCGFACWSDGETDNPRTVTVLGDTMFTALFYVDSTVLDIHAANALDFAIAPNPAGDHLYITTSEESVCHLEIYDDLGRCMVRQFVKSPRYMLDISNLPAGKYLFFLRCEGRRGSRTFIKQ